MHSSESSPSLGWIAVGRSLAAAVRHATGDLAEDPVSYPASAIHGVGIDVADVARISRLVCTYGPRFTRRWFSEEEAPHCKGDVERGQEYARSFAAKEAVWKSLRIPDWSGVVPWKRITVLRHPAGDTSLTVRLTGELQRVVTDLGVRVVWLESRLESTAAIAAAIAIRPLSQT